MMQEASWWVFGRGWRGWGRVFAPTSVSLLREGNEGCLAWSRPPAGRYGVRFCRGVGVLGPERGAVDERAHLAMLVVVAVTAVAELLGRALPGPAWERDVCRLRGCCCWHPWFSPPGACVFAPGPPEALRKEGGWRAVGSVGPEMCGFAYRVRLGGVAAGFVCRAEKVCRTEWGGAGRGCAPSPLLFLRILAQPAEKLGELPFAEGAGRKAEHGAVEYAVGVVH